MRLRVRQQVVRRSTPLTLLTICCATSLLMLLVLALATPSTRAATLTVAVASSADDARSDDANGFSSTETAALIGSGNGTNANITGLRFTNIAVPRGALIDSVELSLIKHGTEWKRLAVDLGFEAADSAEGFSAANPPAARQRTSVTDSVSSDIVWRHGNKYKLGDPSRLAAALQEVIDRPGWQSGNSIALIAYGPKDPSWARLDFATFDAGDDLAPAITIIYHEPVSSPRPSPSSSAPPSEATLVLPVAAADDDVRSTDLGSFMSDEIITFLGSGNGENRNVAGFRFTDVNIPPRATIDSVEFSMVKAADGWQRLVFDLAFEASDDAVPFSSASPPEARTLTNTLSTVDWDQQLTHRSRYDLGIPSDLSASLQEVINRPGWQAGNSVALIADGPAIPAWARTVFYTFDADPSLAPQLTISYHVTTTDPNPTATATPSPTPTMIPATPTSTPELLTPTPTSLPPTATLTPTPPPPTPTSTPTSTPISVDADRSIEVGAGFSDVSPHQLVRSSSGVLYIIVPTCDAYPECPNSVLHAYRANQAGTPTGFTAQDVGRQPAWGIGSSAIAIDGNDVILVILNDRDGHVHYNTFDTTINRWGAATTMDDSNWTTFGQGDQGVGLAIDASGTPHAVWNRMGSDSKLQIQYASQISGEWSAPVRVDDAVLAEHHQAWHPTLAFTPDGSLVLAWLDGSFNYTPDGTIRTRVRDASGVWSASVAIPDQAMTSIDNGPSLLVSADGTRHLTFLDTGNAIRYWYDRGSGWQGDRQPPTQLTHNPSLGPDGSGGIYLYGHGTPEGSLSGHGDHLYRFHLPVGGSWSPWTLYTSGAFDSSVGTRWSQFFHHYPEVIDVIYWADPYPNILYTGVE